jgi:hypothetical protein
MPHYRIRYPIFAAQIRQGRPSGAVIEAGTIRFPQSVATEPRVTISGTFLSRT